VLDKLYANAVEGCDTAQRAWLIAAAHPRVAPSPLARGDRELARRLFFKGQDYSLDYAFNRSSVRPLRVGIIKIHAQVCVDGSRPTR
jgi:hypothetical protein